MEAFEKLEKEVMGKFIGGKREGDRQDCSAPEDAPLSMRMRKVFLPLLSERLLGTPNEKVWSGVSKLINWHEYPQWNPQSLATAVPNLDDKGLHLLAQMLKYEHLMRISAKKAMEHPYFDDFNKAYL